MGKTHLTIEGESFLLNGRPTYWGVPKLQGLLLNSRMVQATFEDLNPETQAMWAYPDGTPFDAEVNTTRFIEQLPVYHRFGLRAFTINLQGGSPQGYSVEQPWHNSAFTETGGLREACMARVARVLDAADEHHMVVILGLFYFGQDQRLADEAAVIAGTDAVTDWLVARGDRHVIVEVCNECNVPSYTHEILKPDRVDELIQRIRRRSRDAGLPLPVSVSYGGNAEPWPEHLRVSDVVLLHGNGVGNPARIREMVVNTRRMPDFQRRPQPIVFNEDDHFDFEKPDNNMLAAIESGASWGYFDYRMQGEPFEAGYQSVPTDWTINHPRKRGFFDLCRKLVDAG